MVVGIWVGGMADERHFLGCLPIISTASGEWELLGMYTHFVKPAWPSLLLLGHVINAREQQQLKATWWREGVSPNALSLITWSMNSMKLVIPLHFIS